MAVAGRCRILTLTWSQLLWLCCRKDVVDGLIKAKDDAELLALAKQIRDKRIEIIEDLITDNLEAA